MLCKKILPIILTFVVLLSFAGCSENGKTGTTSKSQKITIQDPTSDSLDEYKKPVEEDAAEIASDTQVAEERLTEETTAATETAAEVTASEQTGETTVKGSETTATKESTYTNTVNVGTTYCANTNTKKFHYSYCRAVKKMNPENMYNTNSRTELIGSGYVPCAICNP